MSKGERLKRKKIKHLYSHFNFAQFTDSTLLIELTVNALWLNTSGAGKWQMDFLKIKGMDLNMVVEIGSIQHRGS